VNGIHDLGGMHGFGPIEREANEPVFHAEWERRVLALAVSTMGVRHYNVDEFRRSIECMPPASYLAATYYQRWLFAMERLMLEKMLISSEELAVRIQHLQQQTEGADSDRHQSARASGGVRVRESIDNPRGSSPKPSDDRRLARFHPGDIVIARNRNPQGHTRLPRYARGRRGVVRRDWGVFAFPDTHAHSLGANPQHCYSVEFTARELWGDDHDHRELVYLDLWEDYLLDNQLAGED
jgi:nitrile hydratase beta subunit